MHDVRLALTGFGNVGRGIAILLERHAPAFEERYGLRLLLTGVADQRGAVAWPDGLDLASLVRVKAADGTVAAHTRGEVGLGGDDFLARAHGDVLLETASANFEDAEPGWGYTRAALARGMDVVLASKGALTLHFRELIETARDRGRLVRYSATVGAPLPSLDIAQRSLAGQEIQGFEAIVNGTSNTILTLMADGATYEEGVRRAQEIGIAETDPTLDVDGWDAAAKTVILANTLFDASLTLDDVDRTGIRGVSTDDLEDARRGGQTIKLIASVRRDHQGLVAEVRPQRRPLNDPLGRLRGGDMGFVFLTELYGRISATVEDADHQGALPTSMTVLRDVINLGKDRGWALE
ncbi:MAG: homoserine dehydrogenase [Chloroflexota bacterium]